MSALRNPILFLHLAAAIFWMGGMAFMVLAMRPAAHAHLPPPLRLPFATDALRRFFVVVMVSIAVLLLTGLWLLMQASGKAPPGWHAMAGLGVVMMLIFGHIYLSPFRKLQAAVAASDWPRGGELMQQITMLAKINLGIGWVAIAAVVLWR